MKFFKFFAIVLTLAIVFPVSAQVTIEQADIPNDVNTVMPYYAVQFADGQELDMTDRNIGTRGANVTWDFTDLIYPRIDNDELIASNDAPHFDQFNGPQPNRILSSTDGGVGMDIDAGLRYEFLANDGLDLLGIELDPNQGLGIPMEYFEFDNHVQLLPLPANYVDGNNVRWDMNTTFTYRMNDPVDYQMFDYIDIVFTFENAHGEIDAYGTLAIPAGIFDVLRVYTVGEGNIVATGHWMDEGNPREQELETRDIPLVRSYRWYAEDYGEIASVTSRDDENTRDFTIASKIRTRFIQPTYYTGFTTDETFHKLVVTGMTYEEVPIPTGWEIGAFTPDDELAGGGVWNYNFDEREGKISFPMYGGNTGFSDGEAFTLKMWDPNAEQEYATSMTPGGGVWSNGGLTEVAISEFQPEAEQHVQLNGWNLLSLAKFPTNASWYMLPNNRTQEFDDDYQLTIRNREWFRLDVNDMIALAGYYYDTYTDRNGNPFENTRFSQVALMKTETGDFNYPNYTFHNDGDQQGDRYFTPFNNVPEWDLAEGQQMKVDNAVEFTFTGTDIPYNYPIEIEQGYNIIPYYPDYNLPCTNNTDPPFYAISPIADEVFFIKNDEGHFAAPEFNFSNLRNLIPSEGYKIYVNSTVELQYLEAYQNLMPEDEGDPVVDDFKAPVISGENMSIIVRAVSGFDASKDLKIAAYDAAGTQVGIGIFSGDGQCGLAVWADDPTTDKKEGCHKGDAFELRLLDEDEFAQANLTYTVTYGKGMVYEDDSFLVIDAKIDAEVPDSHFLNSAFPNPFNSKTKISYGLPESDQIRVSVYNQLGQEVATLFEGKRQAGFHTNTFVADGFSSGLYFVRLETSNQILTQKVMLVK